MHGDGSLLPSSRTEALEGRRLYGSVAVHLSRFRLLEHDVVGENSRNASHIRRRSFAVANIRRLVPERNIRAYRHLGVAEERIKLRAEPLTA